jgi:small conductance mechanosensitive channel
MMGDDFMQVFLRYVLLLLVLGCGARVAAGESGQAITTGDPAIPVDELELRLKPLTRAELKVEADGWQGLLQDKVREISLAEIAAKYKKAELEKADQVKDALAEVEEAEQEAAAQAGDGKSAKKLEQARQELEETLNEAKASVEEAQRDTEVQQAAEKALSEVEAANPDQSAASGDQTVEGGQDAAAIKQEVDRFEEQQAEVRTGLLTRLTELRAGQIALIDRTNTVVDAFEAKGGAEEEVTEYRQYIKAVSGIKVDVSDTQAVWTTVTGWLKSPEGGLRWARNLIMFVVIVFLSVIVSNMVGKALQKLFARTRQTSRLLGEFTVTTARRLTIAIGIIIGLAAMEVNVGPLLAVIGAAGFVIAFALQNSLGNFASGILILVFRPFDVGDMIEVAGVLGTVKSMNLLSVHIRTPDNKSVIVANNQIWGGVITNVTGTDTRRVDLVFGIAYQDDIDHARRVMEEVVSAHEKILADPQPVIRVHELGDSSVNFVCRPWVHTSDYWDVYWDITAAVKKRFDAEGISIPFPQRDVHLIQEQPA